MASKALLALLFVWSGSACALSATQFFVERSVSRRSLMIRGTGSTSVPLALSLHLRGGEGDPVDEVIGTTAEDAAIDINNISLDSKIFAKEGFLDRTPIKDVLGAGVIGVNTSVTVCGWARTIRIQGAGTFAFIELNDGSTFQSLQASCIQNRLQTGTDFGNDGTQT